MATVPEHPLRDEAPMGFSPQEAFALELTYAFVNHEMVFSYRTALVPPGEPIIQRLTQATWSALLPMEELRRRLSLDIKVKKNCIVVLVTDKSKELFWSLLKDGITTSEDRSEFYYELRYRDGDENVRRTEFTKGRCREISFKAQRNTSKPTDTSHKFNFNVAARNEAGEMEEVLIDPDIKNPSV
ncbi:MAG TPA: nucleotide synthetase [Allosphingosinicella sp.]